MSKWTDGTQSRVSGRLKDEMSADYRADTPWPVRLERNVCIVEAYAAGRTIRQIAEDEGISHVAVLAVLRGAGIDTTMNRKNGRHVTKNIERNRKIVAARARGDELRTIARRYNLAVQSIERIVAAQRQGDDK
jgi:Mor family transcriptional regulator